MCVAFTVTLQVLNERSGALLERRDKLVNVRTYADTRSLLGLSGAAVLKNGEAKTTQRQGFKSRL